MAEDRRSSIGNEAVGARLGRLFQRNRTQEERDILEAYRTQTPVDEIRRRRAASAAPAAEAPSARMAQIRADETLAPTESAGPGMAGSEVVRALQDRNAARTQRRPNARMSPRAAQREASADELNQRELERVRAENEAEGRRASAAERLAEMGGSGDIGAASARARGEQVGPPGDYNMKKGGRVKKMAKGGAVKMAAGGASRRGDGCAARGKTKGRMV